MCRLATWVENAIKLELYLSNKNGRENQKKRGGSGVEDTTQ